MVKTKKALIISYYFPPQLTVLSRRIGKFSKYFNEYGWQPIILTVKNPDMPETDISFYNDIKDKVKIYKSRDIFSFSFFKRNLFVNYERLSDSDRKKTNNSFSLFDLIAKKIIRLLLLDDKNKIGWILLSIIKGIEIIKKENIDVIYSSPLPYSSNLVGYILSRITKVPWVAEGGGIWLLDKKSDIYSIFTSKIFNKLIFYLSISKSQKFVVVTPQIGEHLKKAYKNFAHKIYTIICGYDENDFRGAAKLVRKDDDFIVTYAGTIYSNEQLEPFCEAVRNAIDENRQFASKLKIYFYSNLAYSSYRAQAIVKYNLQKIIILLPYVAFSYYIEAIKNSDLLLFSQPPSEHVNLRLGTKIFDYLRTGKPILALLPKNGGASSIIEDINTVRIVDIFDVDKIKAAVLAFYSENKLNKPKIEPNFDKIKKYNAAESVEKLCCLFNQIIEEHHAK